MLTIYSEDHRYQNGAGELIDGRLQPPVEKPERAEQILAAVQSMAGTEIIAPESLHEEWLSHIHPPHYVHFLRSAWEEWTTAHGEWDALPLNWVSRVMRPVLPTSIDGKLGYYSFDAGTPITAGTWRAITASADVALTGARRISQGAHSSFSLCRPPGHHASADCYGGYCFLNNAALAASFLRDSGFEKVAIVDVDYHHGNGTQSIFYERSDVLFVSIHADPRQEFPFFLGHAEETGDGAGTGYNLNLPLPWGTGWGDGYERAMDTACRRVDAYNPDVLIVSFGADAHKDDPISQFRLETEHFGEIGKRLRQISRPTLIVMEGGYAIDALGANVVEMIQGFEA